MSRIVNLVLTDQTRNLAFNSNSFSTLKIHHLSNIHQTVSTSICCLLSRNPIPSSGLYSWNIVLTGLSASALTVSPYPKQQSECCVKIEVKACSCSMQSHGMVYALIQSNPLEQPLPDMDLPCLFHHFLPWTFQDVPVSAVASAWNTRSQRSKQMAPSSLCILNFLSWQYHHWWSWDAKVPPLGHFTSILFPWTFSPEHLLLFIPIFSFFLFIMYLLWSDMPSTEDRHSHFLEISEL